VNLTHATTIPVPATSRLVPTPARVMRCGGIDCPPGTCDHTDDPDDATVHRSTGGAAVRGGPVPPSVLRVLATPGAPLDSSVRTAMEARLGHDFGSVRVHTDADAARSARSIQAHAYTFGTHVVMGAGRYQPHAPAGSRLLAHELTHVIQQAGNSGAPTTLSDPADATEQEAERAADAPQVARTPGDGLGRLHGEDQPRDRLGQLASGFSGCATTTDTSGPRRHPRASLHVPRTVPDKQMSMTTAMRYMAGNLAPTTLASQNRGLDGRLDADHLAISTSTEVGHIVARNGAAIPGTPGGGPGGCEDLLQQIIELLNEVAQRFNDALNDPHDLFNYHRKVRDAHPDYGSWDGHEDRYNYDRERLRTKLAEWEADDRCRGFPLSRPQQEEIQEAREFAQKNFPARPAPTHARSMEGEPAETGESVWDKLKRYLPEILVTALIGVITVAAAIALFACFGSGACELGLILAGAGVLLIAGVTAAMRAAGVRDTSSGGPVAAAEESPQPEETTA